MHLNPVTLQRVVGSKTSGDIIVLFAVRIELWVIQLSVAKLRQNLLTESSATLGHAWKKTTTRVTEIASNLDIPLVVYWAERLVWTKLALHLHAILVTVLITLVHVTSANITTVVAALAVVGVRSSILEEGVVAKFPLQILNVGIVVEVTWLYLVLIRGL